MEKINTLAAKFVDAAKSVDQAMILKEQKEQLRKPTAMRAAATTQLSQNISAVSRTANGNGNSLPMSPVPKPVSSQQRGNYHCSPLNFDTAVDRTDIDAACQVSHSLASKNRQQPFDMNRQQRRQEMRSVGRAERGENSLELRSFYRKSISKRSRLPSGRPPAAGCGSVSPDFDNRSDPCRGL